MSKTVKNISTKKLAIPEVGVVEAGATIVVPDEFINPNFEVVTEGAKKVTEAAASKTKDDKKTTGNK